MPDIPSAIWQEVAGRNALKADLGQTVASASLHGMLPEDDRLGTCVEAPFPMGWARAAQADRNSPIPFSHMVIKHREAGCKPGNDF